MTYPQERQTYLHFRPSMGRPQTMQLRTSYSGTSGQESGVSSGIRRLYRTGARKVAGGKR